MPQLISTKLPIPRHLMGFYYLRTAIHTRLCRPDISHQELLELVAKFYHRPKYKTTPQKVSRRMAHALKIAGINDGAHEFIAKVTEQVRRETALPKCG